MSTISITITPNDFGNPSNGVFTINFNDGSGVFPLTLTGVEGVATSGYFSLVPFVEDTSGANQAYSLGFSFVSRYKSVGGTKNISWAVNNNVITFTAKVGTFSSASYTGDWFGITSAIDNSVQIDTLALLATYDTGGDCDTINFRAAASGGTAPYTLRVGSQLIQSTWDGQNNVFPLNRGQIVSVNVTDSAGAVKSQTISVPRKLAEGDFKVRSVNYEFSSDLLVERVVTIANTSPLEYSIDNISETSGQSYGSSNAFTGINEGQYKIFIKDKYGCEISKTINVTGFQDATEAENPMYFDIPEGQSFIISEFPEFSHENKKNYFNTGSYNQDASVNYRVFHNLDKNDSLKGQQIKSSFDFHAITLHDCADGSKKDVPIIQIQENLGATERMDCILFEVGDKTGVYFQGGNTYVPDTNTILGTNTYNGTTPRWAEVGQLVFLDGLGGFRIETASFDSDKGGYFVIDVQTPTQTNSIIQVTYNRHDYNLFEFFVDVNDITETSFLVIEKGFYNNGSPVLVGNPWVSEFIRKMDDTSKLLKIDWSDPLNKGDIVFQSGISFMARLFGEMTPVWFDEAETETGDEKETSIVQKTYMGFEVLVEAINQKQITQLNIASTLDGFKVNGLVLVRKKAPEVKPMDKSNLWTWSCQFGYGDNKAAIQPDEIVFSPSTGVEGGGSTGKSSSVNLSNITLYKNQDGKLVKNNGNLLKT
jgi:hypothetical protein